MEGKALCHGAATIVNGIAVGKGASFGIDLFTEATVVLNDDAGIFKVTIENDIGEDPGLAIQCVKDVLEKFGLLGCYGANITTRSDIPISRGLKSSSAAANSIIMATYRALGEEFSDQVVIKAGVEASFRAGVTITGAYDDACAAFYGGAVVTDNIKRRLLRRFEMPEDLIVLVHVPGSKIRKKDIITERLKDIGPALGAAHSLAFMGDYRTSLLMNGLLYGSVMGLDISITLKAMESGAITAGITGTGPATVVLCEGGSVDDVISAIGEEGVLRTRVNNKKATIF